MADVTIYTDGSCNNNTKDKGGYGIVMINGHVRHFCGGQYKHTTSARMEILAIIRGLAKCRTGDFVTVYSDNQYAVNALSKGWVFKWEKIDFFDKRNADLWKQFLHHYRRLNNKVTLLWLRGHNGHEYNEMADRLARQGSQRESIIVDCKQYDEDIN